MRGRRKSWASAMANRMCGGSGRRPVEERLTRPQRLQRQPSHVDYKKLRKLILSRKLAPCFDALEVEDPRLQWDLEECPICFFYYPSLNRSTCCAKGICTECFLQMTPWDATRPPQCPFCKTPCYAVEYHGARTEEEKGLELAEEQRVIEAKIRMLSESENVEQVMSMDHTQTLEVGSPVPDLDRQLSGLDDGGSMADMGFSLRREGFLADCSSVPSTCCRQEESPLDLEEILMMDAIWESLQVQASKDAPLHEWVVDQTSGSSNCVGLEAGANQLSNSGALFASVGSRSRTGLIADSSKNSIMSDPTNVGCSRSVDLHSTLNAYVECEDCASDGSGQSSSRISSLIFTEQPLMLATGSKA